MSERRGMALRHALSKLSSPPLISAAWICNPWRSLRAQVSPVCPQIIFVIPGTPCSGSAAFSTETVVFMFVKLFTGMPLDQMVSSKRLCRASYFPPYKHIPVKFHSLISVWWLYNVTVRLPTSRPLTGAHQSDSLPAILGERYHLIGVISFASSVLSSNCFLKHQRHSGSLTTDMQYNTVYD